MILVAAVFGCAKADSASNGSSTGQSKDTISSGKGVGAAPGDPKCPSTGLWAECSLLYRLDRAGIAPRVDSGAKVEEKSIGGGAKSIVVKIGMNARLDVFLYPDSATRIADEQRLDRTQFVAPGAEQTIRRERTLIENSNLVGLLTSINGHQRDRVADAIMAGPPQPTKP
jgi:hypothetical protein